MLQLDHRYLFDGLVLALAANTALAQLGERYCPGNPNSTGVGSTLSASGSTDVALNNLDLRCQDLPPNALGYFIVARDRGFAANPAGSAGNLCLGLPVGRILQSLQSAGAAGSASFRPDLMNIPQPGGPIAVAAGERLRFQFWHRDTALGAPAGSNFSDGLDVRFCTACTGAAYAEPRFVLTHGTGPMAASDIDGDGDEDLVTFSGVGVSTLVNGGTGSLVSGPSTSFTSLTESPVIAEDLDGDGDSDLVLSRTSLQPQSLAIFNRNSIGELILTAEFPLAIVSRTLTAGDFDGDGDVDLAAVGVGLSDVQVLRGLGNGLFQAPTSVATGAIVAGLDLGDMDGDGRGDIVVTHREFDRIAVLRSVAPGVFAPPQFTTIPNRPSALELSDVDGDTDLDLVLVESSTDVVAAYINNGGGASFTRAAIGPATDDATFAKTIAVGDLDGDGDAEVGIGSVISSTFTVYENLNGVSFAMAHTYSVQVGSTYPLFVDIDNDGARDFVCSKNDVVLLRNRGDGVFEARERYALPVAGYDVEVGDVDGDGLLDAVSTSEWSDTVSVTQGTQGGSFSGRVDLNTGNKPYFVELADLDGDGDLDIAIGNSDGDSVSIHRNLGGFVFAPRVDVPVGGAVTGLDSADLDLDGDVDIAVTAAYNSRLIVLDNVGAATFALRTVGPAQFLGDSLEVADVDGDGASDLVVAAQIRGGAAVFWNDGQGGFGSSTWLDVLGWPSHAVVSDLDGDGDLDVVTLRRNSSGTSGVTLHLNLGARAFAAPSVIEIPTCDEFVRVGDLEGDGDQDIVVGCTYIGIVLIEALGGGTYAAPVRHTLGSVPTGLAIADLDRDGLAELLTANEGWLNVLRRRCR